ATNAVRHLVLVDGQVSGRLIDREQRAAHGLAWFATYVEAVRQLAAYAQRMRAGGRLGAIEELVVRVGLGEYLAQMLGGIPMSQGEIVRVGDLGLTLEQVSARVTPAIEELIATGNTAENRARLVALMRDHHGATVADCGLDETLEAIREEMRKFAESEVAPHAHEWHLTNSYIPMEGIDHMAELGVLGLTIPEESGGMGHGHESWIGHPGRADLMALLVRTDPKAPGYRGLSMLLADEPRVRDEGAFPAHGMAGGEIEVLGYRGMAEFEIGFGGFEVKADN